MHIFLFISGCREAQTPTTTWLTASVTISNFSLWVSDMKLNNKRLALYIYVGVYFQVKKKGKKGKKPFLIPSLTLHGPLPPFHKVFHNTSRLLKRTLYECKHKYVYRYRFTFPLRASWSESSRGRHFGTWMESCAHQKLLPYGKTLILEKNTVLRCRIILHEADLLKQSTQREFIMSISLSADQLFAK